jgi:pimeloyl-ACP methyl ester carboxylesterase
MKFVTDLKDLHRKIDVPVALVWGDQDPFFPVAEAEKMVDEFPNATFDAIEGAGLFSHEENPAAVAHALLPTLTGER